MAQQEIKPGYKTTEFWLTIAVHFAAILESVAGVLDPKWAAFVMMIVQTIYTVSRMQAKATS